MDEVIAPNTYIQLIQSVWAEIHASTLYSSIVYRHDFLSIKPTGSAVPVCIWHTSLVFHFACSPTYSTTSSSMVLAQVLRHNAGTYTFLSSNKRISAYS